MVTIPETFKHFASAWESTPTAEKTLDNLTARLIAEEMRYKSVEIEEKAVAFKASGKRCHKCNKIGHWASNCKARIKDKTMEVRCFRCNKVGHISIACKEKQSSREEKHCNICKKNNHLEQNCYFRKEGTNKTEENRRVSFLVSKGGPEDIWIVDSGSTSHMTNRIDDLEDFKETSTTIAVAKTNESMPVKGVGNIKFEKIKLKEVMYVPELSTNLLSVNAITKNGGEVLFAQKGVTIKYKTKIVLKGQKLQNGLIQVKLVRENKNKSFMTRSSSNKAEMWHRKLGHISNEQLKKLMRLSIGVSLTAEDLEQVEKVCKICQEAKQTRTKFGDMRTRANRPLQLIHTDVCGPITPSTWDGKRYFITFLDDYTHHTITYLIKNKYEVPDIMMEHVKLIETKWNMKVEKIKCDNGKEVINNKIIRWCKRKGIQIDNTILYTPQLNGRAERLNRTLMNKVRALLYDSGLKEEMWGEAVLTSTYLLNRTPTSTLKTTPFEMWENRNPNINNVQLF